MAADFSIRTRRCPRRLPSVARSCRIGRDERRVRQDDFAKRLPRRQSADGVRPKKKPTPTSATKKTSPATTRGADGSRARADQPGRSHPFLVPRIPHASLRRAVRTWPAARRDLRLIDCGCGTGNNLALLRPYGRVFGFDLTPTRRDAARQATGHPVVRADITRIPFASAQLRRRHLVRRPAVAFRDDDAAVREMARIVGRAEPWC